MEVTNSLACLVVVSLYHGTLYGSVYAAHDMSRWHHSVSAGLRTPFPAPIQKVGVDHGGGDILVPEEFLWLAEAARA